MSQKKKSVIKCEGRFHGLRDYLYSEVMPLVLEDRTTVSPQDISNLWELISSDIHFFDPKDPYFDSRVDSARKQPLKEPISLSPLIEMPAYRLAPEVIHQYAIEMGNKMAVADNLVRLSTHNRDFFRDCFNRDPKTIVFPTGKNLAGYAISGDVGIGTIVPGGISGGGIRSDAPFLISVYEQVNRGEPDLAAVVGFWAQDNAMLISQMQPCKNGHFPEGIPFGVGSIHVAETLASLMGFERVLVYSAREHPIFREHPEDWGQLGGDFVCIFDGSSKKLGYDGGRHGIHEKVLVH